MNLLAPLLALAAPFLLWPVELYLPYPYVLEELVKAGLVWLVIRDKHHQPQLLIAIAIGAAFAFSESVLYIFNFNPWRVVLAPLLHITTTLIIYFSYRINRKLLFLGVLLAGLVHFLYNAGIGVLL